MSNSAQTFRFKCSDEMKELLIRFSKQYQYVDREEFKKQWNDWLEENNNFILEEKEKLNELNYSGKLEDKLYLSARYYYRKKSTEKFEPKPRKIYMPNSKELIQAMDVFIRQSLQTDHYQPKHTFESFCKDAGNQNLLKVEIAKLKSNNSQISIKEIENKIKKTYKNRYRILTT